MSPKTEIRPSLRPARTLLDLRSGDSARVIGIDPGCGDLARLLELGILPGSRIRVVRRAPLGCPLEVEIGEARFSIRRELAREVRIEPPSA